MRNSHHQRASSIAVEEKSREHLDHRYPKSFLFNTTTTALTAPVAATAAMDCIDGSHNRIKRNASSSHISLHQSQSAQRSEELYSYRMRSNSHSRFLEQEEIKSSHQRLPSKTNVVDSTSTSTLRDGNNNIYIASRNKARKRRPSFHAQVILDKSDSSEFENRTRATHRRFPTSTNAFEHHSSVASFKSKVFAMSLSYLCFDFC